MKNSTLLFCSIAFLFFTNTSKSSNKVNFTKNINYNNECPAPVITSFTPINGPENTLITITGSNFNDAVTVTFNAINASFSIINDNEITAYIPTGLTTNASISITSSGSCVGNAANNFTLTTSECNNTGEIYISEVYDSDGGSYGAIELYNPSNTTINLSPDYEIQRFGNIGDVTPSATIPLIGSIAPMDTYIIEMGSTGNACTLSADLIVAAGINANDEIKLVKSGAVIDVLETDSDIGYSFIRNPDATAPNNTYINSDWQLLDPENCSNLNTHTVDPVPVITNPTSQEICENNTAIFSVSVTTSQIFTYQWKVLDATGNWINIVNDTNYSGATTNTLTISNAPVSFNNNQYYCEITSTSCDLLSSVAQLEVNNMANTPTLECWETAIFNSTTCAWEITGTQDPMPTGLDCWETATFNNTTCTWEVTGTQDLIPTGLDCWETVTFNNTTCAWEITGTQDPMPTGLDCWQTATFNNTTCVWEITGTQDLIPTGLDCWETATFNNTTCAWEVTGTQDPMPTGLECWETTTFDITTCSWVITGTQDPMPTGLECWETATFNNTTCTWEVITGTQDPMPTGLECWETATFNNTTCTWEITGTQDSIPTGLECWETTTFDITTCSWIINGTQDPMPTGLECWQTATFNNTTCTWEVTGTQDPMPTGLECWETTTFDITICSWIINGTQDPMPTNLECWETTTFNDATCTWEITGTLIDFNLSLSNITIIGNTVTVNMTDTSINYLYTIDSGVQQTNPVFTNISNGVHTLFVQDENGCVTKSIPFSIDGLEEIHIPLFFTPNGDTVNDTWLITDNQNTIKQILIFNRYGKLLKEVSPALKAWDGTYRGYLLESNDYWYLITLHSGKEIKGHFSLKR